MYNVYVHDKKVREEKREKSLAKTIKASEQNRDILTARYKDRINTTLLKLNKDAEGIPKPERAQTAVNSQRSWLKSSGLISDEERIKESENWNHWLDPTPSHKNVFKLRPREKAKEIQPSLKFRAKSGNERLRESISKQKEYLDSSLPPDSDIKCLYKNFLGMEKPVFTGGKEIMNYYHFKTHFKTIESLALDLHSSTRNMSRAEVKRKHNDEKLGMSDTKGQKKAILEETMCKEDLMPISSNLLEKFGVWEVKRKPENKTINSRLGTPKWVKFRINAEKERGKGLLF